MRDRVTFQRKAVTRTPMGNERGSFAPLFTVWAEVMQSLGREVLAAGRLAEQSTARIKVYRSPDTQGLTTEDAVQCRGQFWNIRSIVELETDRNRLEILIERGVAP
jgi:SPP1 family predicted phage head-tail adaptor